MGYNTDFQGALDFKTVPTLPELERLDDILGVDLREHPEFQQFGSAGLTHVDLEVNEAGIVWDGSEKTSDLTEKINVVIRYMQAEFPRFGLIGQLEAQGESQDDRWILRIGPDGFAERLEVKVIPADEGMTLSQYADWVESQWNFGKPPAVLEERDMTIMGFGLAGETGEVMEILKKRVRDGKLDLPHLKEELGDVIFYWTRICRAFGFDPADVILGNVEKLKKRRAERVKGW